VLSHFLQFVTKSVNFQNNYDKNSVGSIYRLLTIVYETYFY